MPKERYGIDVAAPLGPSSGSIAQELRPTSRRSGERVSEEVASAEGMTQSSRSSTVLRSALKMALTHIRGKVARPDGRHRPLLGAVTLETLGLMVNPLTRELLPMRLMLAGTGVKP